MDKTDFNTIPQQYFDGKASFLGMDIVVEPGVFIPRPETELLVKKSAAMLAETGVSEPLLLDMCTGSGVVAGSLAKIVKNSRLVAADISPDALRVAELNFKLLGVRDRVRVLESNMFETLRGEYEGKFNAVVSNPPYVSAADYWKLDPWVKAEPRIALYAGDDGLEHISILLKEGADFLKPGGFMAIEIGYDQASRVKALFDASGFHDLRSCVDMNGYERVIGGWKNG